MSKIILLLGGSGSGKDALKNSLPFPHIISYRTRPIRQGEINGLDGYFVSQQEFETSLEQDQILDYTKYNGYWYWTEKQQFQEYLDKKEPVVYVVDGPGVINLKQKFGKDKVLAIWLDVHELELVIRMRQRGDTEAQITSRLDYYRNVAKADQYLCDHIIDAGVSIADVSRLAYQLIMNELQK